MALLAALLPGVGCTGGGRAQLVPITRSDLSPTEPLIQQIPIREAYYTVEPDGGLAIGLRRVDRSLLSSVLDVKWQMSLVLAGLPAGRERLCQVGTREARAIQSVGGDHRRWQSTFGVVAVQAPRGRRLCGRFHMTVQQQQFSVLAGWTPQVYRGPILTLVGEFEAVRNDDAVHEIIKQTEAEGFGRTNIVPFRRVTTATSSAAAP